MMMIWDIPFWMYCVGWITSQFLKLGLAMLLIVYAMNKWDDRYDARRPNLK